MLLFLFLSAAPKQENDLTESYKLGVIEKIGGMMTEAYENMGFEMKEHLEKKYREGRFKNTWDYTSFSRALNDEALSVCHDKHLRIHPVSSAEQRPKKSIMRPSIEARMIAGNIGYIELHSFMDKRARDVTDEAMAEISGASALIVDIRDNGGGSPDYVRYVSSYFFEGEVLLNSLYWRYRDQTEHFYTLRNVNGTKLPEIPIYVLVSDYTCSAAEEVAYNLQSRGSATIIGETTGGGAHPVKSMKVDEHIELILPVGRAINPVTRTNWEGVGVIPDIQVPAEDALKKANELASHPKP